MSYHRKCQERQRTAVQSRNRKNQQERPIEHICGGGYESVPLLTQGDNVFLVTEFCTICNTLLDQYIRSM